MKTIASSELLLIGAQDVADYLNGDEGASVRVDEDAVEMGGNSMKFRGYSKITEVVVVEGVAVS